MLPSGTGGCGLNFAIKVKGNAQQVCSAVVLKTFLENDHVLDWIHEPQLGSGSIKESVGCTCWILEVHTKGTNEVTTQE
jgi:hypothetical protein